MKSKVDKLDYGELATALTDLSKVKDLIKNEVVKNIEYDEFIKKVNVINTGRLIKKTG